MQRNPVKVDLQAGESLGPYRIDSRIGEGGMGCVFRATRAGDDVPVALKVVKVELASDTLYRRRFLHESRAAAAVSHPHLVDVIDAGEVDGRQYLAMRYMDGPTLEDRIRDRGPLTVAETLRLAAEIGGALDALHAVGLMHRDIKASNILLADDGAAALTDFGLAKGSDYDALTRPGQVVGTLDYLAPERIRGEPATAATDVYALACVVVECLTGKPPFGAKGPMMVAFAHLEEEPPDPRELRPELPAALGPAVNSALAKDAADRPASASAYADLLAAAGSD